MDRLRRPQLAPFSFNSLRAQLLLWIALPAAVVLLAFSLLEIRGHEQAMGRLVQDRADTLAQAVAVLIEAHLERDQAALLQLAGEWTGQETDQEDASVFTSPRFPAGLALYDKNGEAITLVPPPPWQAQPPVATLIRRVLSQQIPGAVTVEMDNTLDGLLIQAVPMPGTERAAVLAGAVPLHMLDLPGLIEPLAPSSAGIQVETDTGMLVVNIAHGQDEANPYQAKVAAAQAIVPETGWRVVVTEPWSHLVPPLLRFANAAFVVVAMAVVVSLLSAYFGLRSIVQPLRRLDWAANEVGWGNFDAIQQPVGGVAEIEDLRLALARMTEQVRQYQQELQSYIGAMTLGQEEERKRLARELHDETVQSLIALNQQVEMVERELDRNPQRAAERLRGLRPLLTDAIAEVRRQIHDLRPLYLEDLGFVPALEMLVRQVCQRHGLIGDFEVSGQPVRRLPPTLEMTAFRIVQEALHNVVTHAQADWVHIELIFDAEGIMLRIEDNGVGFAAPTHPFQLAQQGHYGLLGMQERAQLHSGKLQIESEIGKGTSVTAWLATSSHG